MEKYFEMTDVIDEPPRASDLRGIDFSKGQGLVPAVIQHWKTSEVLMVGYMDEAALTETRESREVVFFSRSRQARWKKGETSGNRLIVKDIRTDCDRDVVLVQAAPLGPVCHLGTSTCFGDHSTPSSTSLPFAAGAEATQDKGVLETLVDVVQSRRGESPDASYTARLLKGGPARVGQKVGEEGVELAIAAQFDDLDRIASEAADLLYHIAVLLECRNVPLDLVKAELEARKKPRIQ